IMADELHADRQYDRECEILAEGLRGAFKDDAGLMLKLCEAHLEAGRVADAERWLAKCVTDRSFEQEAQYTLLKARLLGIQSRFAEAEPLFQQLTTRRRNEAPRYYHAVELNRAGRSADAHALLTNICKTYRRGTPLWRAHEKQWFSAS